jgi:hypothetical protein
MYVVLFARQFGLCLACYKTEFATGKGHALHRIIPGRLGGEYVDGNVVLVCQSCHPKCEGKTIQQIEGFLQKQEYYGA